MQNPLFLSPQKHPVLGKAIRGRPHMVDMRYVGNASSSGRIAAEAMRARHSSRRFSV